MTGLPDNWFRAWRVRNHDRLMRAAAAPVSLREMLRQLGERLETRRRVFYLDAERYKAFRAAIDAPPRTEAIAKLRRLLSQPAPWEQWLRSDESELDWSADDR